MLRIVDVINLASSAKEMLSNRLHHLHRPPAVENSIICSDGPHVTWLRAQGFPVTTMDMPRGLDPRELGRATRELTGLFRSLQPDLVHTHCSVPGLVGRVAAHLARVPIVVHTVHGFHFHDASGAIARRGYEAAERGLAALSDMLLTENREDLQVIRSWRWPRVPARYVGNGIDVDRYARFTRRHSDGGLVVTCIGRFEPVKNHHDLLHVFATVHAACPDARLRLVGEGPLRPECERLARELGIADVTDFVGYRNDVERLLADTDVAVLLSWKEGMSRALLEPMAAGIPAVAWLVKGNRELIQSGESGFLATPGARDETAAQIIRLLREPQLRRRLGAAAAERVRTEFDEMVVVDRLRAAYAILLTKAGRPTPSNWYEVEPEGVSHGQRAVLSG